VNLPTRGIGAKSLDIIRAQAKAAGTSLWEAARSIHGRCARPKAAVAVQGFMAPSSASRAKFTTCAL